MLRTIHRKWILPYGYNFLGRTITIFTFLHFLFFPFLGFAGTFTAYGPETFTRGEGKSEYVIRAFEKPNLIATYKIQIFNGDQNPAVTENGNLNRVKKAKIKLNKSKIFEGHDFEKKPGYLEKEVFLEPTNVLKVRVKDKHGSYFSIAIIGKTMDVPVLRTVRALSSSEVLIEWKDLSERERGFQIERRIGEAMPFQFLAEVGPNVGIYTDTMLSEGVYYGYRVRVFTVSQVSAYSEPLSTVTPLVAPSSLAGVLISTSQVELSWTDNSQVEEGYRIERAVDANGSPGIWMEVGTVGVNITLFSNIGLEEGLGYWYRVRAFTATQFSTYSDSVPVLTPLLAPSNMVVISSSLTQVELSWTDNSQVEEGYRIERAVDANGSPGIWMEVGTVGANITLFSNIGLEEGLGYWYRVRAFNSILSSLYSTHTFHGASCVSGTWRNLDTDSFTAAGLGLREPPVNVTYGFDINSGRLVLPKCSYLSGTIRIPVFMVDWEDFDPLTDLSNENNSASTFPSYVPSTPDELNLFLNGSFGPGQYFHDVSGGIASVEFDVYGWLGSNIPGSYLKPRSNYIYNLHDLNPSYPNPTWQCNRNNVFLDAVRDTVAFQGVDLTQYDADQNGLVDGAVLVYEGRPGLCSGTNLNWLEGGVSPGPPSAFNFIGVNELVDPLDSNSSLFAAQEVWLQFYNNIPERYPNPGNTFTIPATWTHELGHLLLGYSDYYYPRFNVGEWGLSGRHGANPSHPAAFEKWLFARWIQPETIGGSGVYQLSANEIPDGTSYDQGPYLYLINIDGDPNRFLTIESRWFDSAGNFQTQWAPDYNRESGLAIFEFDLGVNYFSSAPPQIYRHSPTRANDTSNPDLRAYQLGDMFYQCYTTMCVRIESLDLPGTDVSLSITIEPF